MFFVQETMWGVLGSGLLRSTPTASKIWFCILLFVYIFSISLCMWKLVFTYYIPIPFPICVCQHMYYFTPALLICFYTWISMIPVFLYLCIFKYDWLWGMYVLYQGMLEGLWYHHILQVRKLSSQRGEISHSRTQSKLVGESGLEPRALDFSVKVTFHNIVLPFI